MSDEEEMVAVRLSGGGYEEDAFFSEDPMYAPLDYLVPRSQVERWKAACAAYEAMQYEIGQAMDEQRERVRALVAERPKSQLGSWVEKLYQPAMEAALQMQPLRRREARDEDDTPWLVTGSKIERWEEEQGL